MARGDQTQIIPVLHRKTGVPADLVLAGSGLEDMFFETARTLRFKTTEIPVVAPEGMVVMKVLAGRPKDQQDLQAVLAARLPTLDVGWIRTTLQQLEEAIGQSDLTPVFERTLALVGNKT